MPDGPYVVKITGRDRVLRELTHDVKAIKIRTKAAMRVAVLLVKAESLRLTPRLTGNLRGSSGTRVFKEGGKIIGEIYYTADYAPYVHEIDNSHTYPTQWKFLETAMKNKKKEVVETLKAFQKAGF